MKIEKKDSLSKEDIEKIRGGEGDRLGETPVPHNGCRPPKYEVED